MGEYLASNRTVVSEYLNTNTTDENWKSLKSKSTYEVNIKSPKSWHVMLWFINIWDPSLLKQTATHLVGKYSFFNWQIINHGKRANNENAFIMLTRKIYLKVLTNPHNNIDKSFYLQNITLWKIILLQLINSQSRKKSKQLKCFYNVNERNTSNSFHIPFFYIILYNLIILYNFLTPTMKML